MSMLLSPRILLYGFLSWLIPFVASIACFGPGGVLWIPFPLFKSLMVVIGAASGLWLLLLAFRRVPCTAANGLAIGALYMVFNLVLDVIVLLPMSGMGFGAWFIDIGLRYLVIPMMGWAIGSAAERAKA
mgnify:CR=1 FL=1